MIITTSSFSLAGSIFELRSWRWDGIAEHTTMTAIFLAATLIFTWYIMLIILRTSQGKNHHGHLVQDACLY